MTRMMMAVGCVLLLSFAGGYAQKQEPPEGGKPKDFVLPRQTTLSLENGLRATFVPYGTIPKVVMTAVIRTGHIDEGKDEVWLADLMGEMLKEGTTSLTSEELAKELAKIGGSISVAVGDDRMMITGDALGEHASRLASLIAAVATAPRFPDGEFERVRNNLLRRLSISQADPQAMTLAGFRKALYGEHPYGRTMPTEQMLRSYTREQVQGFYAKQVGAARTHLFVAGVFDQGDLEQAIRKEFEGWRRGSDPTVNAPAPPGAGSIRIIDRPGAQQSTIYLGLRLDLDPSKADWVPMVVTNSLLGGSFASRITSNIRENKGYTYAPQGLLSSRYRDAYWLQAADVSTEVTGAALKEIFFEVDRLEKTPPPAEELKGIQNNTAGIFVLQNSAPQMIVSILAFMDLHGLPGAYLESYIGNVHAVTPEQVTALAARYLRRGEMTIVVAGDRKKIEKQLAPFGKLTQ